MVFDYKLYKVYKIDLDITCFNIDLITLMLVEYLKKRECLSDEEKVNMGYDTYFQLIEDEFPNFPFSISLCDKVLLELDLPFTDETSIIIKDGRASCEFFGFTEGDSRKNGLCSYTLITQKNGKPITLRQILIAMSNTPEYTQISPYTEHNFLAGLSNTTPIQYLCEWVMCFDE